MFSFIYKPLRDKTNKMSVRPAKTLISLVIRPVWSESSLSAWRKLGSLATHDWKIVDWDVKPQHNQPTNLSYPLSAQRRLWLGGRPGWSESSLGAHAILLVLSRGGSIIAFKLLKIPQRYFTGIQCIANRKQSVRKNWKKKHRMLGPKVIR